MTDLNSTFADHLNAAREYLAAAKPDDTTATDELIATVAQTHALLSIAVMLESIDDRLKGLS